MSVTMKLRSIWRVLRDVNLEAIRADAEAPFVLLLAADDAEDARRVQALLSPGGEETPHPWLVVAASEEPLPALPSKPLFGILISREASLSPALARVRAAFVGDAVGVITVVVSPDAPKRTVAAPGEAARVAGPAIDSRLVRDLGAALLRAGGPEWRLALSRQLDLLRPQVFAAIVEETAQANASYALTTGLAETLPVLTLPMNLGDLVVLTKNQLVMGYRIALAAGLDGDPRRLIPEILGVLGGGLLFRQLARQLVGMIPVLGLVPKVAVAYGGTYALGRAVTLWASEGRTASSETLRRFAHEGLDQGREVARALVDRARWPRRSEAPSPRAADRVADTVGQRPATL